MSLRVVDGRARLGLALLLCLLGCSADDADAASDSGANQTRDAGTGNSTRDAGGIDSGTGHPDSGAVPSAGDAGPKSDAGVDGGPRPDAGVEAGCSGKPGAHRGKVQASVTAGGATRTFVYYAPASIDPNKPVPLIISPHGFAMNGEAMYTLTGFKELADREGLVAVFPDGNDGAPWNVGENISGVGIVVGNLFSNDQAFIDAIIEYAKADQCIDPKHIFVSGFSMGGYFSNEIGCLRSDIASVGPHSGGSHDLSQCPGSIKPVIIFHGAADLLITYNENGVLARDRWVARNGCSAEVESRAVKGGTCDYHRGCPAHGQVALCHFDWMGHAWAGGAGGANADPDMESASELAWKFWREYAW